MHGVAVRSSGEGAQANLIIHSRVTRNIDCKKVTILTIAGV